MRCWKSPRSRDWAHPQEPRTIAIGVAGRDRHLEPIYGRLERGEMTNRSRLPREGRAGAGVDLDDVIEDARSNAGTRCVPTARIITP
jgi:hypothetical protein